MVGKFTAVMVLLYCIKKFGVGGGGGEREEVFFMTMEVRCDIEWEACLGLG